MQNKDKINVDLGCGKTPFKKGAICIDHREFTLDNFIQANFLSDGAIEKLKEKLSGREIDVLNSSYSLCFNKKEKLQEYLPKYFALMSKESRFIINDFGPSETTVINRTHIDEMLPFFAKYFEQIKFIKEKKVPDDDHFHWIIKITLKGLKS